MFPVIYNIGFDLFYLLKGKVLDTTEFIVFCNYDTLLLRCGLILWPFSPEPGQGFDLWNPILIEDGN